MGALSRALEFAANLPITFMARLPTADLRIRTVRSLVSPAVLAGELPLDDAGADLSLIHI